MLVEPEGLRVLRSRQIDRKFRPQRNMSTNYSELTVPKLISTRAPLRPKPLYQAGLVIDFQQIESFCNNNSLEHKAAVTQLRPA